MGRRWAVEDGIFLPFPPKLTNANLSEKSTPSTPFPLDIQNKQKKNYVQQSLPTQVYQDMPNQANQKTSENRETYKKEGEAKKSKIEDNSIP